MGNFKIRKNVFAFFVVLVFVFFYLIGLLFRATIIRIYATWKHLSHGVKNFPENWIDNIAKTDLFSAWAIVPDGENVSNLITGNGLLNLGKNHENPWIKKVGLLCYLVCSAPNLFYRWSLKATLWAWWPLFLINSYTKKKNEFKILKDLKIRLALFNPYALVMLSLIGVTIILSLFEIDVLNLIIKKNEYLKDFTDVFLLKNYSSKYMATYGVAFWFLIATVVTPFFIWISCIQINALYADDLKSRKTNKLEGKDKALLFSLAESLNFEVSILVLCWIQFFWWILLKFFESKYGFVTPFTKLPNYWN